MKKIHLIGISLIVLGGVSLISCGEKKNNFNGEVVVCDAENISLDSALIVPSNKFWSSTFKGGKMVSNEQAKSGKGSVKLFGNDLFGMTYLINNVKSGDNYHAEVWRLGEKGMIVFSAKDSKVFYQAQRDVTEKDEFGWEKLVLDVTIPENFKEKELLVYVWNPNKDVPTFFDDLKIQYVEKNIE